MPDVSRIGVGEGGDTVEGGEEEAGKREREREDGRARSARNLFLRVLGRCTI